MQLIDFRSDTVTRPSAAMKEAMMSAALGDDVLGDDPTVQELEQYAANLFDKEAALFCPSGTMCNQIAIRMHTRSLDELICDEQAHVYQYEAGGYAFNSGIGIQTLAAERGLLTAELIEPHLHDGNDPHKPSSKLVCLENTHNRGGGAIYDFKEIEKIQQLCHRKNLKLHLDGARLFHALVETGQSAADHAVAFDSISICLSKGLGAPIGSLLIGERDDLRYARRLRKVMGGGMRQVGLVAAAGLYALKNNINRLQIDHNHAQVLASALESKSFCKHIRPVQTNIVLMELQPGINSAQLMMEFAQQGLALVPMGADLLRLVTHLDISESDVERSLEIIGKMN
jgi:threonine aldolase